MEGKKINVYYQGIKQTIKIFDNTPNEDIINFVKKIFHLQCDNSKLFFQDEEGNFLLLPPIIPEGLNIHLYIEPEFKENIKNIKPNKDLLPGFKWDADFSVFDGRPVVSNDGYVLGKESQGLGWSPVVSTTIYKKGKLFCKLNTKFTIYMSLGVCSLDYNGKKLHY